MSENHINRQKFIERFQIDDSSNSSDSCGSV